MHPNDTSNTAGSTGIKHAMLPFLFRGWVGQWDRMSKTCQFDSGLVNGGGGVWCRTQRHCDYGAMLVCYHSLKGSVSSRLMSMAGREKARCCCQLLSPWFALPPPPHPCLNILRPQFLYIFNEYALNGRLTST